LNSPKKSDTDDPSHKGNGTFNTRQMILINSLGGYVDNLNKMYKKKKVLQMRMLERLLRR
jgi:hypothetical protein